MAVSLASCSDDQLPKKPVKLAFFDIDGTLLDIEGEYSQALIEEITRIKELGVKTAIASGRPAFATRFLMKDLGLDDMGVFCTGAHIFDPKRQRTLKAFPLPDSDSRALLTIIRQHNIYYELYTDNNFYIERDNACEIREIHSRHLRCEPIIVSFDQVIGQQPVYKLLLGAERSKDQAVLQSLEQQFPQLTFAYASLPAYPQWLFASIIHGSACKRYAFNELLKYYQLTTDEVIAFGDSQSDMMFLSMAGIGVAMGNATDRVKSSADFITQPVWDEGVPYALSRLVRFEVSY